MSNDYQNDPEYKRFTERFRLLHERGTTKYYLFDRETGKDYEYLGDDKMSEGLYEWLLTVIKPVWKPQKES